MKQSAAVCTVAFAMSLASWSCVAAGQPFGMSSSAFDDGGLLDKRFAGNDAANPACTGANVSPPLRWSNVPVGAKSLALLVYDQQGRNGIGVSHQVAYGIPVSGQAFAEGALTGGTGFVSGKGTTGRSVYYGPCPPAGTGDHHYVFTLIATDLDPGALEAGLTREQLLEKLAGHALASAGLVGRFGQ